MNTAPAKHRTNTEAERRSGQSKGPAVSPVVIGLVVALVVVLLAAVAFVLSGGDDSDSADVAAAGEQVLPAGVPGAGPSIGESLPVEPSGEPLPPYEAGAADLAVGMQAPIVNGQAFDGTPLTVGGPTDGPSLYVFLAHWCPHCNDEIPELNQLRDDGLLPTDLNVVGIATASAADAPNYPPSKWAADAGWTWPMLADDELGTTMGYFGGTSFPYAVIVSPDGEVLARKAGSASAEQLSSWITAALA